MSIGWTIDDVPVQMNQDWSCQCLANGGFDRMSGTFPIRQLSSIDQGSTVRGFRTDGSVLYEGQVMSPPKVRGGTAAIDAQGYRFLLDRHTQPLLYQTIGVGDAVSADSAPHGYLVNGKFQMQTSGSALWWNIAGMGQGGPSGAGDAYTAGDQGAFVYWYENCDIRRIKARWDNPAGSMPSFNIHIDATQGPDGGFSTQRYNTSLGSLGPTGVDVTAGPGFDQIRFQLIVNSDIANSSHRKLKVDNIRIWGRTTQDTFYASDVANDVCGIIALDPSGISASPDNVLPLFWTGTAADLLDYLCVLDDLRWLLLEDRGAGPYLDFGPYERIWTGAFEDGGIIDGGVLQSQVYNRVRVQFMSESGETRRTTVTAVPDPLSDQPYDNFYPPVGQTLALAHPQPDDGLANAVATRLAQRLSIPRVLGPVDIHGVSGDNGVRESGYAVRAGDLLDITDLVPDVGPQRIVGVTYTPTTVTADLGTDLDIGRVLWKVAREKPA